MDEFSKMTAGDNNDQNTIRSALEGCNDFLPPIKTKDKSVLPEDMTKKPAGSAGSQTSIFVSEATKSEIAAKTDKTYPTMRLSAPKAQNGRAINSGGLVDYLKRKNLEYVDNSNKSSIIWLIHTPEAADMILEIRQTFKTDCVFERRGATATGNRPAWRIRS